MEKINLELCELNDYLSVDADDRFDDSCDGEFGYRVFYSVPKSEIDRLGVFNDLIDELEEGETYCGELEFSVDENGEQYGEVLLWFSIEEPDGGTTNEDFVDYSRYDITPLIDDFNNQKKK